jgi:hypothetical protein
MNCPSNEAPDHSPVVVYGPSGCGKSLHAQRIAKAYGKTRIVDDWVPGSQLDSETLALTACPHETAVPYLEAARFAGIRLPRAAARSIADATALVRA